MNLTSSINTSPLGPASCGLTLCKLICMASAVRLRCLWPDVKICALQVILLRRLFSDGRLLEKEPLKLVTPLGFGNVQIMSNQSKSGMAGMVGEVLVRRHSCVSVLFWSVPASLYPLNSCSDGHPERVVVYSGIRLRTVKPTVLQCDVQAGTFYYATNEPACMSNGHRLRAVVLVDFRFL